MELDVIQRVDLYMLTDIIVYINNVPMISIGN